MLTTMQAVILEPLHYKKGSVTQDTSLNKLGY